MSYEDEVRQLRDLRKKFEDPIPETIYHYTSAEGFRGIVTSNELWLTNAADVKDTVECKAFLKDCAKHLLTDERLVNEDVKETLRLCLEDRPENDSYYIASFCKEREFPSQYREYGSVCIAFDSRRMDRSPFTLYECVYAEEEMRKWVCEKSAIPDWGRLRNRDSRYVVSDLLFAAQVKCKNARYQNEHEVRMLAVSHDTWKRNDYVKAMLVAPDPAILRSIHADDPPIYSRYCLKRGKRVCYVKFFIPGGESKGDLQEDVQRETEAQVKQRKLKAEEGMSRELLPITEVWIGPMAQQEEVRLASEIMLREKGYENVRVISSQIPYRAD
ncbi:MAG: hypothetical protein NTZ17_17540 [Phycisphaerae bacterium]|nr:hypothetical protein [Phycisphaerae bacterium]